MKNQGASNYDLSQSTVTLERGYSYKSKSSKKCWIIAVIFILLLVAAVAVLTVLYIKERSDSDSSHTDKLEATTPAPTTPSRTNCSATPTEGPIPGPPQNQGPYNKGAVAADDVRCSKIGVDILRKNGSAIDAAIASLFCIGVINMHSAGVGGGAVMVVYNRSTKTAEYFNFREKAPGNATQDMFVNQSSSMGGLSIAVPGEVKGMYEAHKKYGKLKWRSLVEPAIELAREGFIIQKALDQAIRSQEKNIRKLEGLRELLLKEDGCLKKLGDRLVNQKLAITLERISWDPMSFYKGSLAEDIAKDIANNKGIVTEDDLSNYNVEIEAAINATIEDLQLYTTGLPSSGVLIAFMLNVLKGYNFTAQDFANANTRARAYHKIIETFKYAYARRASLGDPKYANVTKTYEELLNETYAENIRMKINNSRTYHNASHYGGYYSNYDAPGTSHLSVLAPNGDAVAVTSTINTYFGSKVRSTVTGITYNNEMDDFSTPGKVNAYGVEPSPSNFIKPGKRPMSSMSPIILTNRTTGEVVFVAGASGGTRITTGTALVAMFKLWFGINTADAVTMPRFHHQLLPNYTATERPPYNMSQNLIEALELYGHDLQIKNFKCVVQAISKEMNGSIYAKSDPRKGGYSDGF